jgi:photosystem II stability/assembly factor-like uncharacterized protein
MRKNCKLCIRLFLIIILWSLVFGVESYPQQNWQVIAKASNQNLWKCSFIDTLNGWAIGDSGTIVYTSNGGYNWVSQNSHFTFDYMTSIFFLNKRLGWAIGWRFSPAYYGTYLLKTTNGGVNWDTTRFPVSDVYIKTVIFLDSLTGYMGGSPAQLLKSTNGGSNWFKCNIDTTSVVSGFPISKFRFYNNKIGIACGGAMDIAGVIWKTTNYGQFWTATSVAAEPINDIKFFDSLRYVALGGDYEFGASVLRTSNGGVNWQYKTLEFFGIPQALAFRTDYEGWSPLGYLPNFLVTNDGGSSWEISNTPDSTNIFDLTFINYKFGIGVGLNGAVIKYFPSPTHSISGTVKYNDNNQPLTSGTIKVFKLNNSTGNIIVVDSALIQSDGSYTLNNVPQDSLDIGVFPNSSPPNDWVITYYPSTIYWQYATVLYPVGNMYNININAFRMVNSTANNSLGGKVIQYSSSPAINIKDAVLYVKNGDTFVKCAVSDANGLYNMHSLPAGNLKIIVNRLGYSSDSTTVTVTEISNIDSINFYLHKMFIGINQISSKIPSEYKLFQNYPNPFNPTTKIRFQIPKQCLVILKVYDVLGREIATLLNENIKAGEYEIPFSIFQYSNNGIPSGIYFYRLRAGDFIETKRMVLIK